MTFWLGKKSKNKEKIAREARVRSKVGWASKDFLFIILFLGFGVFGF
jgi:hypothetical protein